MENYYYELTVTPSGFKDEFSDLIMQLSQSAIEEDDKKIILRSEDNMSEIVDGIKDFASALDIEVKCNVEQKDNEDWIEKYRAGINPIEAGKFYVHPTWHDSKEDKLNIVIDPALAFGSGHHETTNSCLEMIGRYVSKDNEVLDVGCGSGILSIAAAKCGARISLCDTDAVSIDNAKVNLELNKISEEFSWVGSANKATKQYDVTVANIVADVILMIAKDIDKTVKKDGTLILSGILENYKDKIVNKFSNYKLEENILKNEWVTLVLKKEVDE